MRPVEVRARIVRVQIPLVALHHEARVRHVRFSASRGASRVSGARVVRARVGVGRVELKAISHALGQVQLKRVVERPPGVPEQHRFRHVETEDGRPRFESNQRAAGIGEVVIQHAVEAGIRKTEGPADPALACRRPGVERTVGAACRDVGLVEPLEDVIGRVRRVHAPRCASRRSPCDRRRCRDGLRAAAAAFSPVLPWTSAFL